MYRHIYFFWRGGGNTRYKILQIHVPLESNSSIRTEGRTTQIYDDEANNHL